MVSLKICLATRSVKTAHETSSQVNLSASSLPDCVNNDEELAESKNLCYLEYCNRNAPDPTRLDVDKESSARIYGKRKH